MGGKNIRMKVIMDSRMLVIGLQSLSGTLSSILIISITAITETIENKGNRMDNQR